MLSRDYHEEITTTDYADYAVIKRSINYYAGGAHGMYRTEYRVFDRKQARFVTLSDIADADRQAGLRKAVEEALRKKFELGENESLMDAGLFGDEIELPENFFLSDEGIGFHWGLYELAPYSFGEIEAVVPLAP
jgi:hypothetical protein